MPIFFIGLFEDLGLFFFLIELYELFYILEINLLPVTSFENISSHSIGWLFILFLVSFAM